MTRAEPLPPQVASNDERIFDSGEQVADPGRIVRDLGDHFRRPQDREFVTQRFEQV